MMSATLMQTLALVALAALAPIVSASKGCSKLYQQCGGITWEGPTCCESGTSCLPVNSAPGFATEEGPIDSYGSTGTPVPNLEYKQCLPSLDKLYGATATWFAGSINVLTLTIEEQLKALEAGDYTSEELTLAYLAQIAEYEATLNAFTFLNENALAEARASDRRRAAGGPIGSLEGVPAVVKEALNVKGKPSTFGWNYTAAATGGVFLYPIENAELTQRIIDAGSILIGKTNIPAFALSSKDTLTSWAGVTLNAINPDLVPGGSSAGTATAVAAGFAAWGVAEETGGSIQNPGAAQSLVSVKTTFGIVPLGGVAPLAGSTRDVLGPVCRTTKDCALALDAMTGYGTPAFKGKAPKGGYSGYFGKVTLKGKKIGLYGTSWEPVPIDPELEVLYEAAVEELEALGAEVVRDPFKAQDRRAGTDFADLKFPEEGYDKRGSETIGPDFFDFLKTLGIDSFEEFKSIVGVTPFEEGQPLAGREEGLPPAEAAILLDGVENPSEPPDLGPFNEIKAEYLKQLRAVFSKFDLDALVYPHATNMLPEQFTDVEIAETTVSEANIAGTPVVTVPSTVADAGNGAPMPFSLVFAGLPNSEATLLALAHDYEQSSMLRIVPELYSEVASKPGGDSSSGGSGGGGGGSNSGGSSGGKKPHKKHHGKKHHNKKDKKHKKHHGMKHHKE